MGLSLKVKPNVLKFYCVCCNRERSTVMPARVGSPQFFFHIALTTIFLGTVTYPWFHIRGFFAFAIPVGLVFEALTRMKMRDAIVCPDCHFDPTLYYVNRKKALQQVEESWRKKFETAGFPYPEKYPYRAVKPTTSSQDNLTKNDASV